MNCKSRIGQAALNERVAEARRHLAYYGKSFSQLKGGKWITFEKNFQKTQTQQMKICMLSPVYQ